MSRWIIFFLNEETRWAVRDKKKRWLFAHKDQRTRVHSLFRKKNRNEIIFFSLIKVSRMDFFHQNQPFSSWMLKFIRFFFKKRSHFHTNCHELEIRGFWVHCKKKWEKWNKKIKKEATTIPQRSRNLPFNEGQMALYANSIDAITQVPSDWISKKEKYCFPLPLSLSLSHTHTHTHTHTKKTSRLLSLDRLTR